MNMGCGPAEERVMLTVLHAVADIYCGSCKIALSWIRIRFLVDKKKLYICIKQEHASTYIVDQSETKRTLLQRS